MAAVILDDLHQAGITMLPPLTPEQITEVRDHLRKTTAYTEHVQAYSDGAARDFDYTAEGTEIWCHAMADVVAAPHFFEFALQQVELARAYLEALPRLYSMNAFWTRPGTRAPVAYLQEWHRDNDDDRFLAFFVYGTDVEEEADGPHEFQIGTHLGLESGGPLSVLGTAGTAWAADTHGLHRGSKPKRGHRLLLWARYGVSDPPRAYLQDRLEPVPAEVLGDRYPADPELREIVRLVVR